MSKALAKINTEKEESRWSIIEEPRFKGRVVEAIIDSDIISSSYGTLTRDCIGGTREVVGDFPRAPLKIFLSKNSLFRRLLRQYYYNVIPQNKEALFVSFDKQIGVFDKNGFSPIKAPKDNFRILRGSAALSSSGGIFFGEYLRNSDRGPINIFTLQQRELSVAYTFAAKSIRHIHGIYHDPYTNELWCCVGDNDSECRIIRSSDEFKTIDIVGSGDETWRAVSVAFSKDAIYYAMDAEFIQNKVYRIDRKTGIRDELGILDGPTYYSAIYGDSVFFGVTAELCPSQQGPWATLWVLQNDQLSKVRSFKKDKWSPKYFMPGTIHFPSYRKASDDLYLSFIGLQGINSTVYKIFRN